MAARAKRERELRIHAIYTIIGARVQYIRTYNIRAPNVILFDHGVVARRARAKGSFLHDEICVRVVPCAHTPTYIFTYYVYVKNKV